MKPTDFSAQVTHFLTHCLAAQRNLSPNTVKAYPERVKQFETPP
jgi:site-specific recombinase XerD